MTAILSLGLRIVIHVCPIGGQMSNLFIPGAGISWVDEKRMLPYYFLKVVRFRTFEMI